LNKKGSAAAVARLWAGPPRRKPRSRLPLTEGGSFSLRRQLSTGSRWEVGTPCSSTVTCQGQARCRTGGRGALQWGVEATAALRHAAGSRPRPGGDGSGGDDRRGPAPPPAVRSLISSAPRPRPLTHITPHTDNPSGRHPRGHRDRELLLLPPSSSRHTPLQQQCSASRSRPCRPRRPRARRWWRCPVPPAARRSASLRRWVGSGAERERRGTESKKESSLLCCPPLKKQETTAPALPHWRPGRAPDLRLEQRAHDRCADLASARILRSCAGRQWKRGERGRSKARGERGGVVPPLHSCAPLGFSAAPGLPPRNPPVLGLGEGLRH